MEKKKNEFLEWTKAIVIAVLLAVAIRTFLFTPIIVDGQSMEPTLHHQDRMVVSKIGSPDRFDIVVFHADQSNDYIKRVIGLPGDTIEYKNDVLYINGKAYEEEYLEESKKALKEMFGEEALLTENFTLEELFGVDTVPEDTVFVLGDNRRNSKDSRHIGFIPFDEIIGNTKLVYWPLKDIQFIK